MKDLDLAALALDVAQKVEGSQGWADGHPDATLESIEVVRLGEGQEPGLLMRWRQGPNPFGLLSSVRRLLEATGTEETMPFYLGLAIDEPHRPAPDGVRVWFTELPSGPH